MDREHTASRPVHVTQKGTESTDGVRLAMGLDEALRHVDELLVHNDYRRAELSDPSDGEWRVLYEKYGVKQVRKPWYERIGDGLRAHEGHAVSSSYTQISQRFTISVQLISTAAAETEVFSDTPGIIAVLRSY
jgi:hypothetical protein